MCSEITRTSQKLPVFIAFFESKLFWISGDDGDLFSYDIVEQNIRSVDSNFFFHFKSGRQVAKPNSQLENSPISEIGGP